MIDLAEDTRSNPLLRLGAQPIALTAVALLLLIAGVTSIAIWRAYTGAAPETDRAVASRQLQVRAAQASEQLVEKTKGLEATQQESIDQLQVVQDQLLTMKRLLASQQADTKRLSEQVANLNESIDGLRQSFASVRSTEADTPSVTPKKPARHRHASARKRSRS
ncbi:hypothetical protein JQ631_27125 [Bradyrhizobium manausense]|jgi:chromosome segregation ATPase|uniref:hypothetical protein n=1 Tax=Bradyrhizobium manausense TaxID=989370 RepID=UPI001BA5477D|nr:hypothetical protein [Bradyrhizobium manausense]MBR0792764.1 hypothetical protein [Bradyrhizobium manausense]